MTRDSWRRGLALVIIREIYKVHKGIVQTCPKCPMYLRIFCRLSIFNKESKNLCENVA